MARTFFSVHPGGELATTTSARTLLQLRAPQDQRVVILRWGFFFDGVTAGNPAVICRLIHQSTDGTEGPAATIAPNDRSLNGVITLRSTAVTDFTAEPTTTQILELRNIHPTSGYEGIFSFPSEWVLGSLHRIGLVFTASVDVNVIPFFHCEE